MQDFLIGVLAQLSLVALAPGSGQGLLRSPQPTANSSPCPILRLVLGSATRPQAGGGQTGQSAPPLTPIPAQPRPSNPHRHAGHYLSAGLTPTGLIPPQLLSKLGQFPEIKGISITFTWPQLEQGLGQYDFTLIDQNLALVAAHNGQLVVQIRDKSFPNNPYVPVPAYTTTPTYAGGYYGSDATGYVAKRWQAALEQRFRALILALGAAYDTHPNFEALKTTETATIWQYAEYDPVAYVDELFLMIDALDRAFPHKLGIFFINWLPQNVGRVPDLIQYAASKGVAVGGPDIHPDVSMPTYPHFPQVSHLTPVAMDVQYSNYDHVLPQGDSEQLYAFGVNQLHTSYLMWTLRAPFQANILQTIQAHPVLHPLP